MKKVALFAFNGDLMCFIHALLNALEMKDKGYDARIIIEGSATKLIPELSRQDSSFYPLYARAKDAGVIDGVCKACSNKMGTIEAAKSEGLPLLGHMSGHPSMSRYIDQGCQIISF
ncbi:MAG: cytoplasmic protein [Deltaproteobacteria bacterium]|nr:cytoplasmic protein [Deltaproteobacteria bacterium]MBW1929601.1 cytoplasmic protein [Deltaproteobacteria bacterium]MBW2026929.1 cytoplasmic protein [Deltaproteobacteria bacterium]MBW2126955.1 cytoplasmic protein [Deltaproteobacteria bacterium]RLB13991.1 MAG: cytoplasmic protein [Deltaproteobacteria bacterium]